MKKVILAMLTALLLASCASLSLPEDANLTPDDTWKEGGFVDNLGIDTGDRYISTVIHGTFSNSATTNSGLSGKVLVYNEMGQATMRFELKEYSRYPVTIVGSAHFASATESGERLSKGFAGVSGRYILLYNQKATEIIDALARGEDVKIVIEDNYYSRYNFTIPSSGFGYRLQELLK